MPCAEKLDVTIEGSGWKNMTSIHVMAEVAVSITHGKRMHSDVVLQKTVIVAVAP